jgi:hypothetical protein
MTDEVDANEGLEPVGPDVQPTGDEAEPMADDAEEERPHEHHLLDRLRESPVGTNDPNIVGEPGPYDVAPGTDPQDDEVGPAGLPVLPPGEEGTAVV